MKKIIFAAFVLAVSLPVAAQDTYESARLLGGDLNGTARYVGMGGAMEALGADISIMGTNPAGIGLFRHTNLSVSFGVVSQQDAQEFDNLNKTNMSFDQLGFVWSGAVSDRSYINVGFNYHKSRNFDQILSVADHALRNASLNGLTWAKNRGGCYELTYDKNGFYGIASDGYRAFTYTQFDDLNLNGLYMGSVDEEGPYMEYNDANLYNFDRAHRGWIADYDFNVSGNYADRVFWGVTLGVHDVRYKGYGEYAERLNRLDENGMEVDAGVVAYGDSREIKGTGFDVTAGVIVRPMEDSPFRVGVSVKTPTFYSLETNNFTELFNNTYYRENDGGDLFSVRENYEFHYFTPWKFGVSLGHTIGSNLALGVSYEFSDYGAARNRIIDGSRYNWATNDYYDKSHTDKAMKRNTEQVMKGVSTLKVGAEFKPIPQLALRAGYNYVSAAYDENGYRDTYISSPGVMYASTADYVNWKATNRFTCGLGARLGSMNIDLAYQYSKTDGDFHAFQPYYNYDINKTVAPDAVEVSNKRHQLLLTLGYTF
jgi:hypothetical protein